MRYGRKNIKLKVIFIMNKREWEHVTCAFLNSH